MKNYIKSAFLLVCVTAFSSCSTIAAQSNYKQEIAGMVGCLPDEIQVTPAPNQSEFYGMANIMYAECKGVKYICSNSGPLSCSVAK